MKKSVSLIILTKNEINGLKALFSEIPLQQVDECLAVDGNSTDGTREFLEQHAVPVVSQTVPGRAEAFRLGVKHARGKILVFFSPDGNEDPADIIKLAGLISAGADMAIASRFLPGARNEEDGHFFPARAWANRAFTFIANRFFNSGPGVSDSINGFRAISKKAFRRLNPDAAGFTIEYQLTIRAMKKKMAITEIPTIEGNRIGGRSTSSSIPTGIAFVRLLAGEIFSG